MSDEKLTTLYSHRLVTAIEETRKHPLHSSIQEAFLQVPRHLFVDAYYQGNEHVSTPITHDEESWHHWLAQIYRDEALVTQMLLLNSFVVRAAHSISGFNGSFQH